jgi:hypothetical protein
VVMNDRQRISMTKIAGERLVLLSKALDAIVKGDTVMGRMRDQQGPLRARSYEPSAASGRHDGTFAAANHTDVAVHDEADLDRRLRLIAREVNGCWEILARYPVPHRGSAVDKAGVVRDNDPGCQNCAQTTTADGNQRWEPPRPDGVKPSTVKGRLPEPMLLCTWCYDRVRAWDRLPTKREVERHHRGSQVPWPLDVPKPK